MDVEIFCWYWTKPSRYSAAKSSLPSLKMKRGRKVPKYSCHTSLDMPQHSKWSSPLHLARAIVYQGKLRFLFMPFFWLYEPLPTKIPREVPDLQVFLHNQIFNPFKQDPQFERMIPDSFWVLCILKSSEGAWPFLRRWGGDGRPWF